MITLISFLLTLLGSINWFCIGVLQYDFIAGIFGSQANIFSRIIYAFIGLSAIWLIYSLIKNKGNLKFFGGNKGKDFFNKFKKDANKHKEEEASHTHYNNDNTTAQSQAPSNHNENQGVQSPHSNAPHPQENQNTNINEHNRNISHDNTSSGKNDQTN